MSEEAEQAGRLRPPGTASDRMRLGSSPVPPGNSHAGYGVVEVQRVAGRSSIVRQRATEPLKLICPRRGGDAAWVYTSTYGGGLVAGDEIDLSLHLREATSAVVTTQASTKVYRRDGHRGCRQRLYGRIEPGATLAVLPDPLTCFADADYAQHQRLDLVGDASLVLLDWITSGRRASGERWAFARYLNQLELYQDDRCVLRDALRLTGEEGPLADPVRLGGIDCYATLVLAGPRLAEPADDLVRSIAQRPLSAGDPCLCAASRSAWGALVRVAGTSTEQVAHELVQHLRFLRGTLGAFPWDRKW